MAWLSGRGEEYAYAFENRKAIRAAIDRTHVRPDAKLGAGRRDRLLPADDGGIASLSRHPGGGRRAANPE